MASNLVAMASNLVATVFPAMASNLERTNNPDVRILSRFPALLLLSATLEPVRRSVLPRTSMADRGKPPIGRP